MPIRFTSAPAILRERCFLPDLFCRKRTEIIHLCAAHVALLRHFDFGDARRMKEKNALDADSVRHFPDGKRCSEASSTPSDHDSEKLLDSLLVSFNHADMHVH